MPSQRRTESPWVETVDTTYLQTLLGYNARRAALKVIERFIPRMAVYGFKPVDFSVMSVIAHNPGVTSRQICTVLDILPPNLVGMINQLQERGLIERRPHPRDRRAQGLHLTAAGQKIMRDAERAATELEDAAAARLSAAERRTLHRLLQKVYLTPDE